MILQCPSCNTRFLVDTALILPIGREVKCAKCAHQWFVAAPEDSPVSSTTSSASEFQNDVTEESALHTTETFSGVQFATPDPEYDIPFSSNVPSLVSPAPASNTPLLVLAALLVIGVFGAAMLSLQSGLRPILEPVYSVIGMTDTQGLALADVRFRLRPSRSKARFVVEGYILNESQEEREVPILRVSLVDTQGEVLLSREYEADAMLKPGESYPFKAGNLDTAFGDRVDHLVVELGNGVELMLRK